MEKRYSHSDYEKKIQSLWEEQKTYSLENNPGKLYSIDTPPPTVSGKLHIGHIFSYTQADFIARYKRMSGFSVFYPFGFDDNGLPTERFVEKKCKTSASKIGRSAFISLCLEQTALAAQQFEVLWRAVGLSVNWDACYSTISDSVRAISQESFIELYNKKAIYRKNEPALYCTECKTSIAQAELADKEKASFFNNIIFTDNDGNNLVIGTTRPELLPSCVALFYNPADTRYQHLHNKAARVPIFGHTVPILADEHVSIEKGTGLVMCCTFGDKMDIAWYKNYNLEYKPSFDAYGKYTAQTGILAGLKLKEARKRIIEELQQNNLLVSQTPITHTVNVHERCDTEIEFMMLSQWFLNIMQHKTELVALADKISWNPAHMKSRYVNWVENLGWDWCLSRQRFYGIPFPVWHCQDCKHMLLAPVESLPVDPQEQSYPNKVCDNCKSSNIIADTDVMDTWNTSSLTPYICYSLFTKTKKSIFEGAKESAFLPMGMRPQAHDIIRTWAFYTIIKTWLHNKTIPWNSIVISGHVLSDTSDKISKSKENAAFSPDALLERYSADVIRYWAASGSLGNDISFSEMQLKLGQRLVTKLWNAFLFIKTNVHDHGAMEKTPQKLGMLNEWLLHNATECFDQYRTYMEKHDFNLALDVAEKFFWNDLCDTYIELVKDQFFHPENYDEASVYATRWTLHTVGLRILQLYAPYLPYVTEALYAELYQPSLNIDSIHQTKFSHEQTAYNFAHSKATALVVVDIIKQVRKLATQQQLSLKTNLESLTIAAIDQQEIASLKEHEQLIKGAAHAQAVAYVVDATRAPALEQVNGQWHATIVLMDAQKK